VAGVLLAAAACHEHGPAAPSSVTLVVSAETVTVPRNAASAITVQVQRSNGTSEDVTAVATWTSSAPAVVTVQAGMVRAVGVGTATVTVSYSGLSRTIAVVARRNTRLTGAISIEDTNGWPSIPAVQAYLEAREVYGLFFSGGEKRYTIPLGDPQSSGNDTSVEPGQVHLVLRTTADPFTLSTITWASRPESYVEIRDRDTDDVLARLPLAAQTATRPALGVPGEMVWPLTIDVFH